MNSNYGSLLIRKRYRISCPCSLSCSEMLINIRCPVMGNRCQALLMAGPEQVTSPLTPVSMLRLWCGRRGGGKWGTCGGRQCGQHPSPCTVPSSLGSAEKHFPQSRGGRPSLTVSAPPPSSQPFPPSPTPSLLSRLCFP